MRGAEVVGEAEAPSCRSRSAGRLRRGRRRLSARRRSSRWLVGRRRRSNHCRGRRWGPGPRTAGGGGRDGRGGGSRPWRGGGEEVVAVEMGKEMDAGKFWNSQIGRAHV